LILAIPWLSPTAALAGTWLVLDGDGKAALFQEQRSIPQEDRGRAHCLAGCAEQLRAPQEPSSASQLRLRPLQDGGGYGIALPLGGRRLEAQLRPYQEESSLPLNLARALDRTVAAGDVLEFLDLSFGRLSLPRVAFRVRPDDGRAHIGSAELQRLRARLLPGQGILALGDPPPLGGDGPTGQAARNEERWREAFTTARQRIADAEEEVRFLRRFRDQTMASGAQRELEEARRQLHALELEALQQRIPRAWWRTGEPSR